MRNPEVHKLLGTHWTVLDVNDNNVTYFDGFDIEYIQKEIPNCIGNKN